MVVVTPACGICRMVGEERKRRMRVRRWSFGKPGRRRATQAKGGSQATRAPGRRAAPHTTAPGRRGDLPPSPLRSKRLKHETLLSSKCLKHECNTNPTYAQPAPSTIEYPLANLITRLKSREWPMEMADMPGMEANCPRRQKQNCSPYLSVVSKNEGSPHLLIFI